MRSFWADLKNDIASSSKFIIRTVEATHPIGFRLSFEKAAICFSGLPYIVFGEGESEFSISNIYKIVKYSTNDTHVYELFYKETSQMCDNGGKLQLYCYK